MNDAAFLFEFGPEAAQIAERYKVKSDIHTNDWIFRYLYEMNGRDALKTLDIYLGSGAASAVKLRDIVIDLQGATMVDGKIADPMTVLDFASGYGCVARHIKNTFAQANLIAIDIHEPAVYFNQSNLDIRGAVSKQTPQEVQAFFEFDFVFCLSFFSHLPRQMVQPWLERLVEFVKPGGILLFTAHGKVTHREHLAHVVVDSQGYGFDRTSEQKDLSLDDYGNALTYPKFLMEIFDKLPDVELVYFRQASSWTHQDVYVLRRLPPGAAAPTARPSPGPTRRRWRLFNP